MKRSVAYPQEVKTELISRYRQSGLSKAEFCRLPDVPIAMSTLSTWLHPPKTSGLAVNRSKEKAKSTKDLNIVCYNIGEKATRRVSEGTVQEPNLQEMIKFQQDVYDCCSRLYRLSCNEQSIRLLSQIKGAL